MIEHEKEYKQLLNSVQKSKNEVFFEWLNTPKNSLFKKRPNYWH